MKRDGVFLSAVILIIIGICIFVYQNLKIQRCTQEVSGSVLEVKEEYTTDENRNHEYAYTPIIGYMVNGKLIEKRGSSSSYQKYRRGEKITIMYNPNKVEEFVIKGDIMYRFMGVYLMVAGAIVVAYKIWLIRHKGYTDTRDIPPMGM